MGGELQPGEMGLLPELFGADRWAELAAHLSLPPRQAQIARLICRGCCNKQIAQYLGIAPDTVRMQMKGLYLNLEVNDRVGAVVRVVLAERTL